MKVSTDPLQSCSVGEDRRRGNLLGVQPWLTPDDYASAECFYAALERYFAAAQPLGWLNEKTIIVLPEYLGTWLLAAGEKDALYQANTVRAALSVMVKSHLVSVLCRLPGTREKQRALASLIRLKADATAGYFHQVISALAQRYGVSIVAGSIVLPEPAVVNGVLHAGKGPLYNATPFYGTDGVLQEPLVRKIFLTKEEQTFLHPGSLHDLPVFATPAGRLGILICADAWFPASYAMLRQQQVELLAVPAFSQSRTTPDERWTGYSGNPAPADVDPADIGRLTRNDALHKYALASRLPASGAAVGLSVVFRGQLWDMRFSGETTAIHDGECTHVPAASSTALVNLWI